MNLKYITILLCVSSFSLYGAQNTLQQRFYDLVESNTPIEQVIDTLIEKEPSNILALLNVSMEYACMDNSDLAQRLLAILIDKLGPEHELIEELLQKSALGCLDADTITVIAIAAGVDPTVASQATAAGPGNATPGNITAPNIPIGNGGGGGDSGISEL
ncbi:hypothetical protein J8L70_12930 [Pseudoalteromonas sp. MMG010]|uniref:hypothetical protein n=1 Tax=Pseudoalteromonas sp. MMG010 TaxID=2822685 RepID=UPI001B39DE6F|nr:hypothetical protein [Pseudoalteromonas sp. MMG010]MBQ4834151.1 hypothetical protein [Pseudoalteromonas sp. MMG010]